MAEDSTVYVIDDDPAVVDSLCLMFQVEGFQVEGFDSAAAFLRNYCPNKPGCLVVDVRMPEMSGLELQEHMRAKGMTIPIILITANGDVAMAVEAVKHGALQFLEKPCRPDELINAVRESLAYCDRCWIREQIAINFRQKLEQLNVEEYAIFRGTVTGQTNAEMAAQLDVSLRTVQFRRASMMSKCNVSSKQELMNLVFRCGWRPEQELPRP